MAISDVLEPTEWEIEVNLTSDPLWLDKTFRFTVKADEREAQILLDTLILGCELKDIQVGGGMTVVNK